MVRSVGRPSAYSELTQHIEQLICSVSGVVPLSHDIRDVVAERQVERWLCVDHMVPSIFSINTDANRCELMAQTCHLRNVRKIPDTFHRCTTDSLQVGNGV